MKEMVLGIVLGIQAGIDWKWKEIPLWLSLVGIAGGIVFCIQEERAWTSVLIACIPGGISLLFSRFTGEVIGYGDGILFLMLAFYLSLEEILSVGMVAFSIAGVVALVLLLVFHKKGKERIAFIPFLSLAYVWCCLVS